MTEDDPFNPPQVPMDRFLMTLIQDRAAWGWWGRGYSTGYLHGLQAGYAEGREDGLRVLDAAGSLLASQRPSHAIEAAAARRRRAQYGTEPLTAEEIRRRAAASWAEVEEEIGRRRAA